MWYSFYTQPGCTAAFVSQCSLRRDSERAAARRLPLTGRMQTVKEEIPLQLIKEHAARACKCEGANEFSVSRGSSSRWSCGISKGGTEKSFKFVFPHSVLTVLSLSHWTVSVKVWKQGGRVTGGPSSSHMQTSWMGSAEVERWMDVWLSVEISVHSVLACSGKTSILLFCANVNPWL